VAEEKMFAGFLFRYCLPFFLVLKNVLIEWLYVVPSTLAIFAVKIRVIHFLVIVEKYLLVLLYV